MARSPFDHVNAIYADQAVDYFDKLEEIDKKSFSSYMVNRIISMNPDYVLVVNDFQKYLSLISGRETYLFYSQLLPKGKRFYKYVKGTKDQKYEPWLVDLVSEYFQISKQEAVENLRLFFATDEGRENLRSICKKFGKDDKQLKKVKL